MITEINGELHRLEILVEKSLELTSKNTEAISKITIAQSISTSNIQRLEEAIKSAVSDSPDIAVMHSKVETLTKVIWTLSLAVLGIGVTLIEHTIIK